MPLALAVRLSLANPLNCFGAVAGADDGSPIYSCGTSAPVTLPLFVMDAVTVATVVYRSLAPPGALVLEAGSEVADDEIERLE